MKNKYSLTIFACFIGIFCQALVINYAPLLFVTFGRDYNITLEKISFLITLSFSIQLTIDAISTKLILKLGHKICALMSQLFSFAGLTLMGILPDALNKPYTGLVISIFIYSVGAGLIEVVISPIVETCPSKKKSATMSLLHSFYSWGHLCVVLISTLIFFIFGIKFWKILSFAWGIIPLANFFMFIKAPIPEMPGNEKGSSVKYILKNKMFLLLLAVMICGGASEQNMAQWVSAFAETGLGVSKTLGDLLGACMFACLMGCSRLFYGVYRGKIKLTTFMIAGGILALFGHIMAGVSHNAFLGLLGCALSGIAVGIMWPGTLSLGAKNISGGTAMFSLMALAGDLGCISGPATVGFIAGKTNLISTGILFSSVFPLLFTTGVIIFVLKKEKI